MRYRPAPTWMGQDELARPRHADCRVAPWSSMPMPAATGFGHGCTGSLATERVCLATPGHKAPGVTGTQIRFNAATRRPEGSSP